MVSDGVITAVAEGRADARESGDIAARLRAVVEGRSPTLRRHSAQPACLATAAAASAAASGSR